MLAGGMYYLITHQLPNLLIKGVRLKPVAPISLLHLPVVDDCLRDKERMRVDVEDIDAEKIIELNRQLSDMRKLPLHTGYAIGKARYEQYFLPPSIECRSYFRPVIFHRATRKILKSEDIAQALYANEADLPYIGEYFYGPADHGKFMESYQKSLDGKRCKSENDRSNCHFIVNALPEGITDGEITHYSNGTSILHRLVSKWGSYYHQIILYPYNTVAIETTPLIRYISSILF